MNNRLLALILGVAVLSVVATYISITFGFSLYDTSKPKGKKDIAIEFEVNSDGNMLEITSPLSNNCKAANSNKKGCFKIKKNKTGLVTFKFTADEAWELKQFTICQGDTKIKDSCGSDLNLDQRLEFFIMDDAKGSNILVTPASGEIDLSSFPAAAGLREFYFFDQNTIRQDYFYNIEACNGGDCIYLDPPVENKGRR